MKLKTMGMALALGLIAAVCLGSPQMGTWKLNEAKSTLAPGAAKNSMVVYQEAGENVKIIVDGNYAAGKPIHNEWVGKFDGKEYPVVGDPTSDSRIYKTIDANTLELTIKKGGKVTLVARIVVSADGKKRTLTGDGTDPQGNKISTSLVYDRQ
jgi:hypothetical protein